LSLHTVLQKRVWIAALRDQSTQLDLPGHFNTQLTRPDTS